MTQSILSALALIAVAFLSFLGARLASRDTRKASKEATAVVARIDERKVDLDEFREVQARNEAALDRAEKERARSDERITQLEEALAAAREAQRSAEERARDAEQRAVAAEHKAAELEQRVTHLEQDLAEARRTR